MVGLAMVVAFATSLICTPLARRLAWRLDAVSRPDGRRKRQLRPTAALGGLAVYAALLVGLVVAGWMSGRSLAPLAAFTLSAGLLCLLGLYDDLREMSARWKLACQILATLPLAIAGFYANQLDLFGLVIPLGWLALPIGVGWLVLCVNALNLVDGMDGLASTLGIIAASATAAVAASQHAVDEMLVAASLAAALAGFVCYNRPPASIYLGDCGSMVLGLTLAVLTQQVSQINHTARMPVAVAILFVPLLDTVLAIARRTLKGVSFMAPDHGHLHHQLLARGLGVWRSLAVLASLAVTAGAAGWWAAVAGKAGLAWAVLAAVTALCIWRGLVAHEELALVSRRAAELRQTVLARLPGVRTAASPQSLADDAEVLPSTLSMRRAPGEPVKERRAA